MLNVNVQTYKYIHTFTHPPLLPRRCQCGLDVCGDSVECECMAQTCKPMAHITPAALPPLSHVNTADWVYYTYTNTGTHTRTHTHTHTRTYTHVHIHTSTVPKTNFALGVWPTESGHFALRSLNKTKTHTYSHTYTVVPQAAFGSHLV